MKDQESCGNGKLRTLLLVYLGKEREAVFERDPLRQRERKDVGAGCTGSGALSMGINSSQVLQ